MERRREAANKKVDGVPKTKRGRPKKTRNSLAPGNILPITAGNLIDSKIKTLLYLNFLLGSRLDNDSYEQHVTTMIDVFKNPKSFEEGGVDLLIKLTFDGRRAEYKKGIESIENFITNRFPFLGQLTYVYYLIYF